MLKEVMIILAVVLFWKFVYYKYHSVKNGALGLVILAIIPLFIGMYSYFFEKTIHFNDIKILYFILIILYTTGCMFIFSAINKHGIKPDIDRLVEWTNRVFGRFVLDFGIILTYIFFFFILIGTYRILGEEHVYLWVMIIGAWAVSQSKLLLRYVRK